MTDEQLKRYMQSIGKEVFVQFYEAFADPRLPDDVIALRIVEYVKGNGTRDPSYKAANTRVSKARSIIKSGNGRVALVNCSQSRIRAELQRKAALLAGA